MREQTAPRFKSKTSLRPGMLRRSKYSRLHDDSLTSLEDRPKRMLPPKRDLCSESDFAQHDPGTSTHHGLSTPRDFIPRGANIRLQGPVSLHGPRGQTNTAGDRSTGVHADRASSGTHWSSGTKQRFGGQRSLAVPLTTGPNLTPSALSCTKRPITLHPMASPSRTRSCPPGSQPREGPCRPETRSALDDSTLVQTALHRDIKYMGSVEVTQSMRTLDFDTRIQVIQEAISKLCERPSAKTTVKIKRPVCKGLSAVLGQVHLQSSGSRIVLAVSADSVTLIAASSSQKIAHHPMQTISFASGGDSDMADYIAYVAKDHFSQRACHILECPQGRATKVIDSIGQAFETPFHQVLSHTPSLLSTNTRSAVRLCHKWRPVETMTDQKAVCDSEASEHGDDYNMIPRRMTPAGGADHP